MSRLKLFLGWPLLAFGLAVGLWALFPLPRRTVESQIEFNGQIYNLLLSAPAVVRAGEVSEAALQLEPPPHLSQKETAGLWWQASVAASGLSVAPAGEISKPLVAGRATVFRWRIRAAAPTRGECALWLHILHAPKSGEETRFTLFTDSWEVKTQWMGGLSPLMARLLAVAALLIGFVMLRTAHEEE